ncbi:hypothetical protein CWC08_18900, partial [Pseudoalteromonas ruthenica]|uniref:hypothetical protein n=1 Tax=Pseudoalteromonas ruthenica TaxID=151081 RepID=UPI00128346C9
SVGSEHVSVGKHINQSHVTLDYKGDDHELVQLIHRYANDVSGNTIEQIGMITSVAIDDHWQFLGR